MCVCHTAYGDFIYVFTLFSRSFVNWEFILPSRVRCCGGRSGVLGLCVNICHPDGAGMAGGEYSTFLPSLNKQRSSG